MKCFSLLFSIFFTVLSNAQTVQWATKLIEFSSEYTQDIPLYSTRYKATQALGVPNTMVYGISELAWAPGKSQAGKESITVGFAQAQYVQQVIIGETYNPGSVKEIILYDEKGNNHTVYENKNTHITNNYGEVLISYKIQPTIYKANRLKLILNTDNVGGMQQIDCIGISTNTAPVKLTINELQYSEPIGMEENLGPNVNSEYFDHLPMISPDGSVLFFARKYAEGNTGKEQKDDIYYSYQFQGGKFSPAENIGPPLNNELHNFVCYISSDNKTLYLANKYKGSTAYVSVSKKQSNGTWGKPSSLNIPNMYNNNEYVHYHLSLDEKTLLMSVQRDDSYGDLDIYVSFKYGDGGWSAPKNLGPIINTVGAEGSVFLAADGKTLYFSSTGHQGYGNYDVFMTKRLDNTWTKWSKPLNLGPKINSPQMDIYYTIPAAGDYAYFSSGRSYFGLNDLFRIKLPKEARPEPVNLPNSVSSVTIKNTNQPNYTQPVNKPVTNTMPVQNKPANTNTTTKPATNSTTDDLQKKLDELKQQQKQVNQPNQPATTTANTSTQPKTTYKTEYVDPKPLKTPETTKPDYSSKAFENIPKVENNDPAKKTFDNLNAQKNNPEPEPIYSTPDNAPKNFEQVYTPASTVNEPVQQPALKTQTSSGDPLQDKLDALKKQQQEMKNNPNKTATNSNNPTYSEYSQPKQYPNPTTNNQQPVTPNSNIQVEYNQPDNYYQPEGTKLPATNPYDKPALKEKQTDQFVQTNSEMEDKINALKQQQQQQKFNGEAPKASKIKVDTTNPAIKYVPPATTNAQPVTASTNADIEKYEKKLKEIQDKMATIGSQEPPKKTEAIVIPEKPVESSKTELPPTTYSDPDEIAKQQAKLDALQQQQKETNDNLNNSISSLNDSKNDLENDITDLTNQRDKINADKNKLSTENAQLAAEKAKLETDKKKMDSLLAQMQAERNKMAVETQKMENEKEKLDALKKQQEKEIYALKSSIDSLKKVQSQAADELSKIPRYDLFDVPIEVGAVAVMSNIYFVADAAFIQQQSYPELDKLVDFMKQHNTLKVEVGGHTNGLCDDIFCNKLSNDRAKSVMDYLVSKGIDKKKLSYKGYGKQYLISKPGDALNQRVEIKILSVQ